MENRWVEGPAENWGCDKSKPTKVSGNIYLTKDLPDLAAVPKLCRSEFQKETK